MTNIHAKPPALRRTYALCMVMTCALASAALVGCSSSKSSADSTLTADTTLLIVVPTSAVVAQPSRLSWPALAVGTKSDRVRVMQKLMIAAGVKVSSDGDFGPKTGVALKAFQREKQLPETDATNQATWLALVSEVTTSSPKETIEALQLALRINKYDVAVSGALDQPTIDALAKSRADSGSVAQGNASVDDWLTLIGTGD